MKLLTIKKKYNWTLGVKIGEQIIDIEAAKKVLPHADVPVEVMELIQGGDKARTILKGYVEQQIQQYSGDTSSFIFQESSIEYGPCVTKPSKIICVGLNYRKHAEETNSPIPEYPILFNKFENTLAAHQQGIAAPRVTKKLDYEAELVIVVGKQAKYVNKQDALDYVFGYCNVNDLSARDLQMRTPQWLLGKCCDGFSPLGPYLVTSDEVGNPNDLDVKTTVNGEVRQQSNTSDMIFYCDEIVSYISQHMTLVPGDIILTGTPEGVVLGYPPEKQVYLKPGDEVTIEIEKLGSLTNRFITES